MPEREGIAPTTQPALKKALGLPDGIALIIGITIGSGIYSTPALIAGYFGSFAGIFTTWAIVGVFVVIGGMIYAELGTRMPETGGEYIYISRCFGPFTGFMFGWVQLFVIRTSAAAGLSIVSADYVGYFVELSPFAHTAIALSVIVSLGIFNYVGVEWASLFQKVTTLVKVVGLILFASVGILLLAGVASQLGESLVPTTGLSPLENLSAALMLIVFTHTGWDRVGYVAGEIRNPREVIPKTMLIGITLIILIYWSMNLVYHYALGMEALRGTVTPAADVATLMVGAGGASIIAVLAIVSAVGSINGTMMSSTRVYYAMARDGLFFKSLDFIHPTFRTPTRAIYAHCIWASVLLVTRGSFEKLASGMVFAVLIFYSLTAVALFMLRARGTGDEIAYKMPFYPWLPGVYLAAVAGLLFFRIIFEFEKSLIDFAFVVSGLPVSFFWLRKGRRARAATV